MTTYLLGTFPYADRARVLTAIDEAVAALGVQQGMVPELAGATRIFVRVIVPQERLGTHKPMPEEQ